jgi:hypothetical protein
MWAWSKHLRKNNEKWNETIPTISHMYLVIIEIGYLADCFTIPIYYVCPMCDEHLGESTIKVVQNFCSSSLLFSQKVYIFHLSSDICALNITYLSFKIVIFDS